MTRCTECCSVEPTTIEIEVEGETLEICGECLCEEDTLVHYDEDYGSDR